MRLTLAAPAPLDRISGGYAYDRRVLAELRGLGVEAEALALPEAFPAPGDADLAEAERRLAAVEGPLVIDGLAYGAASPALAEAIGPRALALVHHPLALETGLSPERRAALEASEREALRVARGVIVTSPATARAVAAMTGLALDRITVAPPGVDPRPRAIGSSRGEPLALLAVGAAAPRKNFLGLIGALERAASDAPSHAASWRLAIVGPLDADPDETARLRARIAASPIGARVRLLGPLSGAALEAAYAHADIFVSSALYEGYGMALAEAIAHGLAVVATPGGAVSETVMGETEAAGVLAADASEAALAAALGPLLASEEARRAAAVRSWAAAARLPRWRETAELFREAALRAFPHAAAGGG